MHSSVHAHHKQPRPSNSIIFAAVINPSPSRKILVVVADEAIEQIESALLPSYALTFAGSLEEARSLVARQPFDLLLCGSHFENAMLDLPRHFRANERARTTPVLCIKVVGEPLPPDAVQSIDSTVRGLGAVGFFDMTGAMHGRKAEHAWVMLRKFIEYLTPFSRMAS